VALIANIALAIVNALIAFNIQLGKFFNHMEAVKTLVRAICLHRPMINTIRNVKDVRVLNVVTALMKKNSNVNHVLIQQKFYLRKMEKMKVNALHNAHLKLSYRPEAQIISAFKHVTLDMVKT